MRSLGGRNMPAQERGLKLPEGEGDEAACWVCGNRRVRLKGSWSCTTCGYKDCCG